MKKILFALCIFCTLLAHGQFAKPTDAVSIPSYQMYRTPADSGVHIFMGNTLLWNSFWMKADTVKTNKSLVTKYYFKTHGPTVVTDNSTNAALYPVFTSATSGSYSSKVSTGLQFNPYYGNLALGGVYLGAAISVTNYLQITTNPKIYMGSNPGTAGQVITSGGSGSGAYWGTPSGGSMTYPSGSGIPIVVSGTSWGSTITNNSSNWNTAYGWGDWHHTTLAGYGITDTPWTGLGYITSASLPTVNNATLTLVTSGSGISGSQTFTANQGTGATFTVTSNATTSNTAGTIVLRDGSGYVSLTGTFCSSDSTLKRNIHPFSKIDLYNASKIDFVKFLYKSDATNQLHLGVIAQQVEKLVPEVVHTNENGKLEVNYPELLVILAAQHAEEIKLLKEQNRQLERRIEKLENHNKWEAKQINF